MDIIKNDFAAGHLQFPLDATVGILSRTSPLFIRCPPIGHETLHHISSCRFLEVLLSPSRSDRLERALFGSILFSFMTPSPTCELSGAQADGNLTARMSARLEKLCAISCSKTGRVLLRKKERGRGHYAPLVGLMSSSVNLYMGHRRHEMEHFASETGFLNYSWRVLPYRQGHPGFMGAPAMLTRASAFNAAIQNVRPL
jgi:hypothetical protein